MKVFYCFFLLSAFTVSLSQAGVVSFVKTWWNSGKNKEVEDVPDIHLKNVHVLPKLKVTGISQGDTTLSEMKVKITSRETMPESIAVEGTTPSSEVKENVKSMAGKPEGESNATESEDEVKTTSPEENVQSTTGKPEGEGNPTESDVEVNKASVEDDVKSTTGNTEGESNSTEPKVEVYTASTEENVKSTTGKPEGESNSMESGLEGEATELEEEANSVKPDVEIASPIPEPSV
jgi:hypothetical protein